MCLKAGYSTVPADGGMAQAEYTWVPGSVPRWFTNRSREQTQTQEFTADITFPPKHSQAAGSIPDKQHFYNKQQYQGETGKMYVN